MYRLATATADVDTGYSLTASYTYADDVLTEIETGSTTYTFAYGDFAQRSSISIGSRNLATYYYTADQNRIPQYASNNNSKAAPEQSGAAFLYSVLFVNKPSSAQQDCLLGVC